MGDHFLFGKKRQPLPLALLQFKVQIQIQRLFSLRASHLSGRRKEMALLSFHVDRCRPLLNGTNQLLGRNDFYVPSTLAQKAGPSPRTNLRNPMLGFSPLCRLERLINSKFQPLLLSLWQAAEAAAVAEVSLFPPSFSLTSPFC